MFWRNMLLPSSGLNLGGSIFCQNIIISPQNYAVSQLGKQALGALFCFIKKATCYHSYKNDFWWLLLTVPLHKNQNQKHVYSIEFPQTQLTVQKFIYKNKIILYILLGYLPKIWLHNINDFQKKFKYHCSIHILFCHSSQPDVCPLKADTKHSNTSNTTSVCYIS
jgi:hypothetical protein